MTASLIIGPAASGKTQACIQAIRDLAGEPGVAPAWVLLPDRAQAIEFRRRLAAAGGGVGVRVETMDALVEEILMRSSRSGPRVSRLVARRLIEDVLADLKAVGRLEHYTSIAETAGLVRALQVRIEELKRAGVGTEGLERFADEQGRADLGDLARVYSGYQGRLASLGWDDREGLVGTAAEALAAAPDLLAEIHLFAVDGFESFDQPQLRLLAALDQASELLVSLGAGRQPDRIALGRFEITRKRLMSAIPGLQSTALAGKGQMPPPMRSLEENLFEEAPDVSPGDAVSFALVRSRPEEVREALRWLKARIVREGCSPEECALLLTDADQDAVLVREVAREFGLPIRVRHGQSLAKAPPVVAMLDLLDTSRLDWPRRLTLEAIRTPYFDLSAFGLSPQQAEPLEACSYWGQVVGGFAQWEDALERLAARTSTGEVEDSLAGGWSPPPPAEAQALLLALQSLADRLAPPEDRSIHDWVQWLEDLLDELSYFGRLVTQEEQAATLRLREVLRALVLAEAAVGPESLPYADFVDEVRQAIESARFQPRMDWRQQAIQVMEVQDAVGLRFRAVALVGLSEGQLPRVERADPFLDEGIRNALGLEPRLGRGQASTFYMAVTRADFKLLLTRCLQTEDGEDWPPSPYWSAALSVFGLKDEDLEPVRSDRPRPFSEAGSAQEISFMAVRRGSLPAAYGRFDDRLQPLRRARQMLTQRSKPSAGSPFEGDLGTAVDQFGSTFSEDKIWSPSRLESYTTCPHLFFVGQLLGVEVPEPPALGPDVRQLGSLLHAVLERAYQTADDPTQVELVVERVVAIGEPALANAPVEYGFRPSPLWDIESIHLLSALENTVRALAEEGEGWRPFAFEQRFGMGGSEPLEIDTDQGRIRLRGIVDRLDERDGRLRVIDYKTGSSHLSPGDLLDGRRLQLPLYALAAQRALGLGDVEDGFYWAIMAARRGSLRLARFSDGQPGSDVAGPAAAYRVLVGHLERFLAGARRGSFAPEPPAGGCPTYCPAAGWCWRYAPGYRG